jgi:iron(III) transport system substrate-binding protein
MLLPILDLPSRLDVDPNEMEDVMKFSRRAYFSIAQLFLIVALLAAVIEPTYAQNPDLLQAAKKEGEIVVFGSLENDVAAAINKGFEVKHGIKTNYFRGSSTVIIDRITSEHRTGRMSSDAVFTTAEPMKFINKE